MKPIIALFLISLSSLSAQTATSKAGDCPKDMACTGGGGTYGRSWTCSLEHPCVCTAAMTDNPVSCTTGKPIKAFPTGISAAPPVAKAKPKPSVKKRTGGVVGDGIVSPNWKTQFFYEIHDSPSVKKEDEQPPNSMYSYTRSGDRYHVGMKPECPDGFHASHFSAYDAQRVADWECSDEAYDKAHPELFKEYQILDSKHSEEPKIFQTRKRWGIVDAPTSDPDGEPAWFKQYEKQEEPKKPFVLDEYAVPEEKTNACPSGMHLMEDGRYCQRDAAPEAKPTEWKDDYPCPTKADPAQRCFTIHGINEMHFNQGVEVFSPGGASPGDVLEPAPPEAKPDHSAGTSPFFISTYSRYKALDGKPYMIACPEGTLMTWEKKPGTSGATTEWTAWCYPEAKGKQ